MTSDPPSASVLRPATPADLDDLVAVEREGGLAAFGHIFPPADYPFPTAAVRQRWAKDLADPTVDCHVIVGPSHVAAQDVTDPEVAGFAMTSGNQLVHFGTRVTTWGSGLAGIAHEEVLDRMRGAGHRQAWLWVMEENHRARRFYARRGWVPTAITSREEHPPHPLLRRLERDLVDLA